MSVARVLIVDDDPALLEALPGALHLRLEAVVVDTADSAAAALGRLVETDYDAVVSDIKMPGMDGLALLAAIRARRPDTPALMITGHGEHDLAIRALRGGAYDFIPKPIDRDYFVAALSRAIEMRHLSRRVKEQQRALERHADELEQILEERTRELREANRAKDEFLALLSHELRAPLTPILTWAEILCRGADPGQVKHGADVIRRNVRLEITLVDDLSDVTRITQRKIVLDRRSHDLGEIVRSSRDSVAEAAWQNSVRLESSTPTEPVMVNGDAGRLQQIFANLLGNAVKFTPRNGRVTVAVTREGDTAVVRVRDTGAGIARDVLPCVFEMFRQPEQAVSRDRDGLGVGLAVAKHLTELHGGTIEATSEGLGRGAEFTVRLPVAVASSIPSPRPVAAVGMRLPVLEEATVLVVDDSADTAEATRAMLETLGARVVTAGDGLEALDAVARAEPDVVLCDLRLHVMDGFELVRRLREDPGHAHLPVIAVSTLAKPADYRHTREAGFDAHIGKPFDYAVLCSALESLLRGRRRAKAS